MGASPIHSIFDEVWEVVEPFSQAQGFVDVSTASTEDTIGEFELIEDDDDCSLRENQAVQMEGLWWRPLPRIRAKDLSYERFLVDYAFPKIPFILTGADHDWLARERWTDVGYFLKAPHVNRSFAMTLWTHRRPYEPIPEESQTTVGTALQDLHELSLRRPSEVPQNPKYLAGWAYFYPGGSAGLDAEIRPLPSIFDRSPSILADSTVLKWPGRNMKWLFIGTAGSATRTHLDVINSAAWLWCARGRKEWRAVHGCDHHLIPKSDLAAGEFPDLFRPDLVRFPWLRKARLYYGQQHAGDIMHTPSSVLHGVRNVEFTVSLTHNFVDAVNFCDVARDLLEHYSTGVGRRSPQRAFEMLCELQSLCSDTAREAMLRASVRDGEDAAKVRHLLGGNWGPELDDIARRAERTAQDIEQLLQPIVGKPPVCAECSATAVGGRRGEGSHSNRYFCNACWRKWEA